MISSSWLNTFVRKKQVACHTLVVRFLFRRAKLDRFLEGAPVVLIEDGKVQQQALDSQLITLAELKAAAHKQGFRELSDVDRCVLETGGSLAFIAKDPSPMQTYYVDLNPTAGGD